MWQDRNPKGIYLLVVILWAVFMGILWFTSKGEMTFRFFIGLGGMFLWTFINVANYRGRYRPRFVYALRIAGLPMLVFFLYLHLIGEI